MLSRARGPPLLCVLLCRRRDCTLLVRWHLTVVRLCVAAPHPRTQCREQLFVRQKQFPDAARIAMKLLDTERIARVYADCDDDAVKKQVSFILGKQQYSFDSGDDSLNELVGEAFRGPFVAFTVAKSGVVGVYIALAAMERPVVNLQPGCCCDGFRCRLATAP